MKTERIPVMFEKELVTQIDDFSFANRIRTRAEAIRRLIRVGLDDGKLETKKGEVTA